MRRIVLTLIVVAGLAVIAVSAYHLFRDWTALDAAYRRFERLSTVDDLRQLFIAEAHQNAFRINCFADGVGVLMGAVLAAIGLHGLCTLRVRECKIKR